MDKVVLSFEVRCLAASLLLPAARAQHCVYKHVGLINGCCHMQFLSQELMGSYDQRQERIRTAVSRFERFPGDTGSSEVQGSFLIPSSPIVRTGCGR